MVSRSRTAASAAARLLAGLGAHKGGKASAAALTAEQRIERGKVANAARWRNHEGLPVDQAAVMARLKGGEVVQLRIAPGTGGKRRRAAVEALEKKGMLQVVESGSDHVTITPAPAS